MPPRNDQDRTEPATPKRRQEARRKGQVAKSREISSAVVLLGSVLVLVLMGEWMVRHLLVLESDLIRRSGALHLTPEALLDLGSYTTGRLVLILAPIMGLLVVLVVGSNLAQVGLLFSWEALSPRLSRLNPVEGLRRILSMGALVELLKAFIKLAIVGAVAWLTVRSEWDEFFPLVEGEPWSVGAHMGRAIVKLGARTGMVLLALAALDYLYQRWEYERGLRMTKEEIKEEFKQQEGDPKVKGRIRQRQREMARRRMIAAVAEADVVITNPQHLAVALHYEQGSMSAPVVVAKGADYLALRIRQEARRHGVPVVEDRPLALALYRGVDVGDQIPVNLYKAVAEVLAYVYRQRGTS